MRIVNLPPSDNPLLSRKLTFTYNAAKHAFNPYADQFLPREQQYQAVARRLQHYSKEQIDNILHKLRVIVESLNIPFALQQMEELITPHY